MNVIPFDYSYEIVSVVEESNTMHIKFLSPGKEEVYVGAELPTEGVELDAHVKNYVPVNVWFQEKIKRYAPAEGTKGEYNYLSEKARVEAEVASVESFLQKQFESRVKQYLVKLGLVEA